jgi:hypothetical protein
MQQGRMVEAGDRDAMLDQPHHGCGRRSEFCSPVATSALLAAVLGPGISISPVEAIRLRCGPPRAAFSAPSRSPLRCHGPASLADRFCKAGQYWRRPLNFGNITSTVSGSRTA